MSALLEQSDAVTADTADTAASDEEIVQFLNRRKNFGDGTTGVEFKETHISWVALTDRRAYKVKKPVRFSFLDYATPERRLAACHDELRLGSRLAPGVYLGLLPITRDSLGALHLGGDGPAVNYCVVMKRLPADRMLDRLIREHSATASDIDRLLGVLVPFYNGATRGPELDKFATATAIERQARENLATIESAHRDAELPRALVQRVRASQLQFLNLYAGIFAERIREGRVCDGHGDLRAEHVCMVTPPAVFDCVEFSQRLRSADVASELAFLAMELDFFGAPELSAALIRGYRTQSGDALPSRLVGFYKSYRACVRAKVELLRAEQQADTDAAWSRTRARRYLQLASFYATDFYRPKLFVMVGAAGTGKSTVADSLADSLGLEVLRTDAIRHDLAGGRDSTSSYGQGLYSDSMTTRTYDTLFDRAESLLGEAVSVVLDGTFRERNHRERAVQLARRIGADLHFVRCRCAPAVARARISRRLLSGDALSDARPEMHDLQQAEIDAADDWESLRVLDVDTAQPSSALVTQLLERISCDHTLRRRR